MNITEILTAHKKWIYNEEGGSRAYLCGADLRDADLRDANLRGADLRDADLRGADLCGAVGNMSEIKSIFLERWTITYTHDVMQIGCQRHAIEDWFKFSDDDISRMDSFAFEWWSKYKPLIKQIIELSPATKPTIKSNEE
jgi:hypothetical protein